MISQGKQALFGDDWNAADSEHGAKISQTLSQAPPLKQDEPKENRQKEINLASQRPVA